MLETRWTTVIQCPKSRYDDHFCALSDELTESFWKSKIPADQHADFAQWRIEDFMYVSPTTGQMFSFGTPIQSAPNV
jgi:hypothetical protein